VKTAYLGLVIALLALAPGAWAGAFSVIVDDSRIKFSLSYPPEVEIGSCFQLEFEATALGDITIDVIKLTLVYQTNGGTSTLLSTVIVEDESVSSGWFVHKVFSVCVPRTARADPFIRGILYANYSRSSVEPLTHEWFLAVARTDTYDEVLDELENAEETISSLQSQVTSLQGQIASLQSQLNAANSQIATLTNNLTASRAAFDSLQTRYSELSADFKELDERYKQTLAELMVLQTRYQELRSRDEALAGNYEKLLGDYRKLTEDYAALKSSFTQLQELYTGLSSRHEAALQQIGELQSQLRRAQQDYGMLQVSYSSLSEENLLTRNVAYAQAAGLVGLGAFAYLWSRKKPKTRPAAEKPPTPTPATEGGQPPATPPPPAQTTAPPIITEPPPPSNGSVRTQKMLSGRRVTIPSEFASKLGLAEGDAVVVELKNNEVVMKRAAANGPSPSPPQLAVA